jgi:hypothetical protein
VWQQHGEWVTRTQPRLGEGVRQRLAAAATISADEWAAARAQRERCVAGGAAACFSGVDLRNQHLRNLGPTLEKLGSIPFYIG